MKISHVNLAKGFRGGERQTVLLVQALADLGCEQQLIAKADSPMRIELQNIKGLEIFPVTKPFIKYLLRGHHAGIVLAHEAKAAQWAFLNNLRTATPYIIVRRVPNKLGNNFFTHAVYRNAAFTVAISNAVRQSVRSHADIQKITVIPDMSAELTVDSVLLAELKSCYAGKFIIGHLGALVNKHKGQSFLIESARKLQSEYPNIHFLLLGEGYDRHTLQQQASDLSNLEFLGYQKEVGTYLKLFDIFAFPSLEEGLGSSLLDAMQLGVPIIASNVGGIPDVVQHEVNGLLVPPANSYALAEQIIRLYKDTDLSDKLVAKARQSVSQYSPAVIAKHYQALYQSLLSSH